MRILDRLEAVRRVDRGGMLGRAAALPGQCAEGWEWGLNWRVPSGFSSAGQILVLGMGGSAIGADLAAGIAGDRLKKPVLVNRTYDLPAWVNRNTLVLVCSYSGNTEETLSAAGQAARRGARIAVITSGGRLAGWARRRGFPLLRIPQGLPPRSAVGTMTFVPLGLMVRLGWIPRSALPVERACRGLNRFIRSSLGPEARTAANPAKKLAMKLVNRLPVLYGAAGGWEGIAYRWRTQLEENSKTLAFHHIYPEATHNEISGWVQPKGMMKNTTALFLTDPAMHPRILRRMEFGRRVVLGEGAQAEKVSVPGPTVLERMLRMIALGDFVSVYLGVLYRIDPTPVVRVEALKKFMK